MRQKKKLLGVFEYTIHNNSAIYLYNYAEDHIYFGVKKNITTLGEQEDYIKEQIAHWPGVVAAYNKLADGLDGLDGLDGMNKTEVAVIFQSQGRLMADPDSVNAGGEYRLERRFTKGKTTGKNEMYDLVYLCAGGGIGVGGIVINTTYNTFWCGGDASFDRLE